MTKILEQDHDGTDWQLLMERIQSSPVAYKVLAVAVFACLLHALVFKQKKNNLFPGWAAIEIALVGHVTTQGGLGRQI